MPSPNRAKRNSPATLLNQLGNRIAEQVDRLEKSLQANQRRRQLRRERQHRMRSDSAAENQFQAVGKALKGSLPKRRTPRRKPDEQTNAGLIALLWPRLREQGLASNQTTSRALRLSTATMLLLIVITLVINAVPFRLASPTWYLQVLAYIAENVPALIIASVFALLSLALGKNDEASSAYLMQFKRLSRFGYILTLLLLPLQLGITAWLYGKAFSEYRTQASIIRANGTALISGAQQTNSTEEFIAYLQSRNLSANLETISAAPLMQVKKEFILGAQNNQQQQEQALAATNRSTILRYTINSVKLFVTLVVLAGFARILQALVINCSLGSDNMQPERIDEITATAEHEQIT